MHSELGGGPHLSVQEWESILIAGQGKSGTKRLLRLMDLSPQTHCRSEPYNLAGSPFRQLRTGVRAWVLGEEERRMFAAEWNYARDWTRERVGDRDRLPPPPKHHIYSAARRLGLVHLLSSRSVRRYLRTVWPGLSGDEWLLPRSIGRRDALANASLVIKLNQFPSLVQWILEERPSVKVVHIVRHPAGFLRSWWERHYCNHDPDRILQDNQHRLRVIAEREDAWAASFGDIGRMCAAEAELWFWRYATESCHRAGCGSGQYMLVLDEDIASAPVGVARRLYTACGLEWTQYVEASIAVLAEHWRSRMTPWRNLLERGQMEIVQRVLNGSPMEAWWDDQQLVSRTDYRW